jgi:putative spermidine/putrescine transport system permease protein
MSPPVALLSPNPCTGARSGGVRSVHSVDAMAVRYMATVLLLLLVALRFVRPTQMVFRLDQSRR